MTGLLLALAAFGFLLGLYVGYAIWSDAHKKLTRPTHHQLP